MVLADWMCADPCPDRKDALQALLNIRLNSLALLVEKVNPAMPCVTQGFGRLKKSCSLCVMISTVLGTTGRMMG